MKNIGFLATGNELVEGDILNTNGQAIAKILVEQGLTIGMHVVTSDRENEIAAGLNFLLEHHDTIIVIGGLGPTSDDRTRYVLSQVIDKKLIFDEVSWQNILARFAKINRVITQEMEPGNRQQALFPEKAIILPNDNGSAAGCFVEHQNKKIFMLPGPPAECLPMFEEFVLPKLLIDATDKIIKLRWLLTNAIESEIAERVDKALKDYPVTTGYRASKPDLEVKIYAPVTMDLSVVRNIVDKIVAPFLKNS